MVIRLGKTGAGHDVLVLETHPYLALHVGIISTIRVNSDNM